MSAETLFTLLTTLPIIPLITGFLVICFVIFSFAITYHWFVYSRTLVGIVVVLFLYYAISLLLIGRIITTVPYV